MTEHPFVLGGAVGNAVLSVNHYRLATRYEAARQRVVAGGLQLAVAGRSGTLTAEGNRR